MGEWSITDRVASLVPRMLPETTVDASSGYCSRLGNCYKAWNYCSSLSYVKLCMGANGGSWYQWSGCCTPSMVAANQ